MKLATFFEEFDQLASAPNAVAKMRELVLEAAVTGKLCHTDAARWKAGALGDVIHLVSGQHLLAHEHNDEERGIPYLTGPSDFGAENPVPTRWTDQPKVTALPGDILLTVKGSGVGKTNVLVDQPMAISRQLMAIRTTGADPGFVHLVLRRAAGHFQSAKTGIAIPGIGRREVLGLKVILPPLAEQKQIVAKVDELMALCDRLEAQQQERETRLTALARASLARFAEAPIPANLNFLFHRSYDIDPADLRKSILTLAVQGKLVEQDARHDSIDALLREMQKRRQQLVDAKRLRKPRELPPVAEDELPFETPASWRWGRWGQMCDWITYGFTRPMSHVKNGPPIVTAKNVQDGFMTFDNTHCAESREFADLSPKDLPRKGDILITKDGTIGRAAIVETDKPFCINQSVAVLWLESCPLYRPFMLLVLRSPFAQGAIWKAAEGMAIKHLSITDFGRMVLPLPPLTEQKRIVAKVDELMALVDTLEVQLAASRKAAADLLDAFVAELTACA